MAKANVLLTLSLKEKEVLDTILNEVYSYFEDNIDVGEVMSDIYNAYTSNLPVVFEGNLITVQIVEDDE